LTAGTALGADWPPPYSGGDVAAEADAVTDTRSVLGPLASTWLRGLVAEHELFEVEERVSIASKSHMAGIKLCSRRKIRL
jgi:hypothetical protein